MRQRTSLAYDKQLITLGFASSFKYFQGHWQGRASHEYTPFDLLL